VGSGGTDPAGSGGIVPAGQPPLPHLVRPPGMPPMMPPNHRRTPEELAERDRYLNEARAKSGHPPLPTPQELLIPSDDEMRNRHKKLKEKLVDPAGNGGAASRGGIGPAGSGGAASSGGIGPAGSGGAVGSGGTDPAGSGGTDPAGNGGTDPGLRNGPPGSGVFIRQTDLHKNIKEKTVRPLCPQLFHLSAGRGSRGRPGAAKATPRPAKEEPTWKALRQTAMDRAFALMGNRSDIATDKQRKALVQAALCQAVALVGLPQGRYLADSANDETKQRRKRRASPLRDRPKRGAASLPTFDNTGSGFLAGMMPKGSYQIAPIARDVPDVPGSHDANPVFMCQTCMCVACGTVFLVPAGSEPCLGTMMRHNRHIRAQQES